MTDIVYGRNPVREALRGRRRVHEVLVGEHAARLEWLAGVDVPVRLISLRALTELARSDEHQGIVARVEPYPYADAFDLVTGERPLLVALDEISDPHNLGAIARCAECAGADGLVLPRHRSATVTAAVCKASAGAVEHLRIAIVPNLADWLGRVKRPGLWVYATAVDGELRYTEADLADGSIVVVGAEGRGIRSRVRRACDAALRLPVHGRIASLNASVSVAVVLYEAERQRAIASI